MSYHLACNLGSKIAAIASVTGSMSPKTFSECTPDHPTPVMQIHGLDDYVVPYLGYEALCEPMDDVINFWVNYNRCNSSPASQIITDLNGDEYGGIHKVYENGENNVSVEFYLLDEMGHEWPRVNAPSDYGSYDIDAPSLIWEFLSKYDINGLIN
jgi:polyhydroxybutyrate depolymerase